MPFSTSSSWSSSVAAAALCDLRDAPSPWGATFPYPVQIIHRAVEPLTPIKPRKELILVLGAVLGLVAGIQLAFLLERSCSKVRSPEDLEQLAGLRAVGVIPHMSTREDKKFFLACHFDPKSKEAVAGVSLLSLLSRLAIMQQRACAIAS